MENFSVKSNIKSPEEEGGKWTLGLEYTFIASGILTALVALMSVIPL